MEKEDKTIEQIIGNRIQKLRKNKGYTQQSFAEKIWIVNKLFIRH